jgi:hypothetical protein
MEIVIKNKIVLFVLCSISLLYASNFVSAATFYFDPQESVVGMDKPFVVALNFDATKSVNAISASVVMPKGLSPMSISDGNSIINTWIEEPTYNESNRTITFSGIIPGGFVGTQGRLISFKLQATSVGSTTLSFAKEETKVLLNGPDGKYDELSLLPQSLLVSSLKNNLDVALPDTTPPESFVPTLFRDDTLWTNKWVVLFNTQDKDSGINHYEVQESFSDTPQEALWKIAHSPYIVENQRLNSNIFIKAVDENENERVEEIKMSYPIFWYEKSSNLIIRVVVISLMGLFIVSHARKYFFKKK